MSSKVARGTLLGIAGQGWHLLTAFLLYAFLARRLGPVLFGDWRVVVSVLTWFEIFVGSGLVSATSKAISQAGGDDESITRASYAGQVVIGLSMLVLVVAFAGPIAGLLNDPALSPLLRIAALDIPLYGLFMLASAVMLGKNRFERQAMAWIAYATAKAIAIAVLVVVGFSVPGALVGNAISSVVGFAVVFAPFPLRDHLAPLAPLVRRMLLAAVPFLSLSLIEGLGRSVDLWMVSGLVTNGVLVGLYASAVVVAEVPTFLFYGVNRVILPAVAGAHSRGDGMLAGQYATQGVRLALMCTVLGLAVVTSAGRQVLELIYSSEYVGAFVPLVVLTVASIGRTVRGTCLEVLMAQDRRRAALTILAGTVLLEVALLGALTPRFGLVGAAAGTAVSVTIAAVWAGLMLRRSLGMRPLATFLRCLVAGAVTALGLAFIAPSPLVLLLISPVVAVVYALLLWLLREFDAHDIASLRGAFER